MADQGSSSEKTEEATPKRLRDSRKKGQVSKSKDLNTVVVLIAAFVALWAMSGYIWEQMQYAMEYSFTVVNMPTLTQEDFIRFAAVNFMQFLKAIIPLMLVVAVASVVVNYLQIGSIFSADPLTPQLKRLNALENLKNMFKATTFIELIKNIAKITLIFIIAYMVVKASLPMVLNTVTQTLPEFMIVTESVVEKFIIRVFVCFIAIAIIDLFVQRHQYKKQMRMSKDEVKREYKQDEGDPHIKGQRRQMHQELAMGDVRQAVASSDAVVTNPTHLAVAIKYDETEMMAPQIVAKGQRLFAQMIREVAEEHQVPIVRNVPLAWSLIELEVGDEIPEDLYAAVAETLLFVYRLKKESV